MINFANGSTTELLAMANNFFQSVWPLVVLIVGVPLGFLLLEFFITIIPRWSAGSSAVESGSALSAEQERFMSGRRSKKRGERQRAAYVAELEAESAELAERERLRI